MILPDLLCLRVVVCCTAAGTASATVRAYYAGPGNQFWSILHETGLTPRRLPPAICLVPAPMLAEMLADGSASALGLDPEMNKSPAYAGLSREPTSGFEPLTPSLRVKCSTS